MSALTFIKNLPSEFTGYYLVPANNRYPCTWGYTSTKEVYHIIQLVGGGQYLFITTDNDYNYLGHSDKFSEANKLGQEYKQVEQTQFYLSEDEVKILLHDRSTLNDTTIAEINRHIQRLKTKPYTTSIRLDTNAHIYYSENGYYLLGLEQEKEDLYHYLELTDDYLLSISDSYQVA